MAMNCHRTQKTQIKQSRRQVLRIDVLPDDVLLEIFGSYIINKTSYRGRKEIEAWQSLVHVCQRWRNLVFRSPRRLDLHLHCTPKTPVKDTLDVWPALPLIVQVMALKFSSSSSGMDNVIAALGKSNRVREVTLLGRADRPLEGLLAAMQVSFPELTVLRLFSLAHDETQGVISDSFLGGSAPRLRTLSLNSISFPGLPKLLLSATHLVDLRLSNIPHSGYISPEAMVASLSALSSLKGLSLEFKSPQSRPDAENRSLPPPNRSILPALIKFRFKGVTEYLEELMTRIDTPQLDKLDMTLFHQSDFDCPQLLRFINCTPTLRALDEAHVEFHGSAASFTLRSRASESTLYDIKPCRKLDPQISSIERACNSYLDPISMVEDLYIEHGFLQLDGIGDAIDNTTWLGLLSPFTAVKNLYLSKEFAPGIVAALQELIGSRITEVSPKLQNIFVEGFEPSGTFQEDIGQFIAARQLSGHPIAISIWDKWSWMEMTEVVGNQ